MLSTHQDGGCHFGMLRIVVEATAARRGTHDQHALERGLPDRVDR
jgi:hypothetical protein